KEKPDDPGTLTGALDMLFVVAHRDSDDFARYDQRVDLTRKPGPPPTAASWYPIVRDFDLPPAGHQAKLLLRDVASANIPTVVYQFEGPPLDERRGSAPILTDS